MADLRDSKEFKNIPIEQHITAAWANIENTKEESEVTIPALLEVYDAKEWVDSNQK